jgi:LCP family protein required for cell wall assembly
MVVSVDPTTGKAAAFSVPRDTQQFPMPDKGTYRPKVNALYGHLQATTGRGAAGMKRAMSRAFGIEVDNYVLIGFAGVQKLVRAVGGVDVTLDKAYYDAYYWVNNRTRGWGLPKGKSHLGPSDALIFARSRKGDNDFGRARRQQLLVMAAVEKVRKRGVDDLPALLDIAADTVRTDLPVERAADLFALFATVDLDGTKRVVFGPRTYAESIGGSSFRIKLATARAWIKRNFPAERAFGTWSGSAVAGT